MSRAQELEMALTNKRWLALAFVTCAMIWFALFARADARPHDPNEEPDVLGIWRRPTEKSPILVVEGKLAQANDRLRFLEIRDSLVRMTGNRESLTVILDPRLPALTRDGLSVMLRRHWAALGIAPRRPVIVAVVGDTVWHVRNLPRALRPLYNLPIDISLPSANTGGACVSVMRLNYLPTSNNPITRQVRDNLTSAETISALLSPCAFFAAFGEPGPDVRNWLVNGRTSTGRFAEWNEAPAPWRASMVGPQYGTPLADVLALNTDPGWRIRKYVSPEGIACLANEPNACSNVLLGTRKVSSDSAWRANVVGSGGTSLGAFYLPQAPTPLGPGVGWVLSEMVRTLGHDRFEKFWMSKLPVADAFKQAAGEDIQDWTLAWALRMYGPTQVGPALSGLGLGTGLFVLVVALAGAGWIESRRRVP